MSALELDLLAGKLEPDPAKEVLLEAFPQRPVEIIAQLAEVVHLAPTVAAPFATGHVDQEIPIFLVVVDARISALFGASACRETVDHALREEGRALADPGLRNVKLLQSILFFVFPLHVLLFICNRIPPNVKQMVRPSAAAHEEGTQVESGAVLGQHEVDRVRVAISDRALGEFVEERVGRGVGNVQWVVLVDITVGNILDVVEDMVLQRL